eukprot:TRINITY_DN12228_c0_g1::TRINITY_DN12228_c0_g1_i1::g.13073::m.13073 TRINITY_DN12228_c0_g1::TRINITY_DN12228_c0_g1_i1::g.13073  ORF type:complete len:658 (-),score=28.49,DUF4379/PF14311.1/0.0029,DUF4379/PF14311.1/0.00018,DUF4379/PF14311.1/0.00024,DUF4379/PF14311.1/9.6e+02 TRINITY_DN12228_c0_g1_i1:201-2174(-)
MMIRLFDRGLVLLTGGGGAYVTKECFERLDAALTPTSYTPSAQFCRRIARFQTSSLVDTNVKATPAVSSLSDTRTENQKVSPGQIDQAKKSAPKQANIQVLVFMRSPFLYRHVDVEENTKRGISLENISIHSRTSIWMKCEKNPTHRWKSSPASFTRSSKCSYCEAETSVASNPTLALMWHPILNGVVLPMDVQLTSEKRYWFRCGNNHRWCTNPSQALTGCPICSGRKAYGRVVKNVFFDAGVSPTSNKELPHPSREIITNTSQHTDSSDKGIDPAIAASRASLSFPIPSSIDFFAQQTKSPIPSSPIKPNLGTLRFEILDPESLGLSNALGLKQSRMNAAQSRELHSSPLPARQAHSESDIIQALRVPERSSSQSRRPSSKSTVSGEASVNAENPMGSGSLAQSCMDSRLRVFWSPDMNDVSPDEIPADSKRKVWFRCHSNQSHTWRVSAKDICYPPYNQMRGYGVYEAASRGMKPPGGQDPLVCPHCVRDVRKDEKSLLQVFPNIMDIWWDCMNIDSPRNLTPFSELLRWWYIDGYAFQAPVCRMADLMRYLQRNPTITDFISIYFTSSKQASSTDHVVSNVAADSGADLMGMMSIQSNQKMVQDAIKTFSESDTPQMERVLSCSTTAGTALGLPSTNTSASTVSFSPTPARIH